MVAGLQKHDTMTSVVKVPWHGYGNILSEYKTLPEFKEASGLWWTVSLHEMKVPMTINDMEVDLAVPNTFAVVRDDINLVLSTVGKRYVPFQLSDMWSFIDKFQKETGVQLETAGSLWNGRKVWILAKAKGAIETVKGDPIEEYFLFTNSFDGTSSIQCLFTKVRVVCHNTYTAAIQGCDNIFKVRHTVGAKDQMEEVYNALGVRKQYQTELEAALSILAGKQMTETDTKDFLENQIFPVEMPKQEDIEAADGSADLEGLLAGNYTPKKRKDQLIEEIVDTKALVRRDRKVDKVLELIETGMGTDIPGVKGTAYGVWNALTEYSDHHTNIRTAGGRSVEERRFESVFLGGGASFKRNAFDELMKKVA